MLSTEATESRDAITLAEAAQRLGVSKELLRQLANRGEVPARRLGRRWVVPLAALQRFLDSGRVGP